MVGRDTPEPIRSGTPCKTSHGQAVVVEPRIPPAIAAGECQEPLFCLCYCSPDWNASGDMGWFGISSNDKPERTWNDELQTLMNEVQDDDYLVAVDCHI